MLLRVDCRLTYDWLIVEFKEEKRSKSQIDSTLHNTTLGRRRVPCTVVTMALHSHHFSVQLEIATSLLAVTNHMAPCPSEYVRTVVHHLMSCNIILDDKSSSTTPLSTFYQQPKKRFASRCTATDAYMYTYVKSIHESPTGICRLL